MIMNLVGSIGFIAAANNYLNAKKRYNEAVERKETLELAIQQHNRERDKTIDELKNGTDNINPNDPLEGVKVTTICRIGNLVGKYARMQTTVVLTNTTEKNYIITGLAANTYILNRLVPCNKKQELSGIRYYLLAGKTLDIKLPAAIVTPDNIGDIRSLICTAAGKKLITSCPKISVLNAETANVRFSWIAATGAGKDKSSFYSQTNGVLRYCMEAFYP